MNNKWCTRTKCRWIKDLNVKSEIIKIVEHDMGDYFYNNRMEKAF